MSNDTSREAFEAWLEAKRSNGMTIADVLGLSRRAVADAAWEDAWEASRAALEAQQVAVPYDQQALELCGECGWKAVIPGESCLMCERDARAIAAFDELDAVDVTEAEPEREPLNGEQIAEGLKAAGIVTMYMTQALTRRELWLTQGSTDVIAFARAIEAAHSITQGAKP